MKLRFLFAAIGGLLGAVLVAGVAFAHSRPIRFDPAPGAVVAAAPSQVRGWFTNELRRDPNWNFIRVTDAQGNRVDTGDPNLSADRRQMSVGLKPGLAAGRYTVTWRSWDDVDGAIFGDCYTFFVGQAAADQAVQDKTRLDGGSGCQRIEISAKNGTPTPEQLTPTPAASGAAAGDVDSGTDHGMSSSGSDNGGSGVPIWALALGIVGGVVLGGIGGRYLKMGD